MRAVIASLLLVSACGDPVHDRAVEALGPEAKDVPAGPLHRPGQPCIRCHGSDGPSSYQMAFGGTVYAFLDGDTKGAGAVVRLLDAKNRTYDVTANCVGNFWVPKGAFDAEFPVTAAITITSQSDSGGATFSRVMTTEMHRSGSCGDCHANPPSVSTPGQLWALPAGTDFAAGKCSGDQNVKGEAGKVPECPMVDSTCAGAAPTYTKDVKPILDANCASCHQKDGETPDPSLDTYKNVAGSVKTRTSVVSFATACRMPPPPLAPLSADDLTTLLCWQVHGFKQ